MKTEEEITIEGIDIRRIPPEFRDLYFDNPNLGRCILNLGYQKAKEEDLKLFESKILFQDNELVAIRLDDWEYIKQKLNKKNLENEN